MRNKLFFTMFLSMSLMFVASCGKRTQYRKPYVLVITSSEVDPQSFNGVQIVFTPSQPNEHFPAMMDISYFNDAVQTSISAGDFVIDVNALWFRSGNMPPSGKTIRFELPLYATSPVGAPSMMPPMVAAYFTMDGTRIASGSTYVTWPLADGQSSPLLDVTCLHAYEGECRDHTQPLSPMDGGIVDHD